MPEELVRLRPEPKRDGVRWVAVPHPELAAAYEAAVVPIVPIVEAALPSAVLANRVAWVRREPAGLGLEPWERARARFRRRVRREAATAGCALMADVRDCYGSIRPAVVEAALGDLRCGSGRIEPVLAVLERFADAGVRGLPIGPAPSAVLANAVLLAVDRALAEGGWRHVRWVDDVIVFARDLGDAHAALARIAAALRTVGLALAATKTRIVVDPGSIRGAGGLSIPRAAARAPG